MDWVTISALATAFGTLVLAAATFASVRSANRAARVAELSLLAGLRPLLLPSRVQDDPQKIGFADEHWVHAPGGGGVAEVANDIVYMAMSLRNVGSGIAVLDGWHLEPGRQLSTASPDHAPLDSFHRLTRDLYIAAGDVGFWQGALRDPGTDEARAIRAAIEARDALTVELLYGDHEGGQRVVTRFALMPRADDGWLVAAGRHWNIDRPDPR
jgi:hypothetical protein